LTRIKKFPAGNSPLSRYKQAFGSFPLDSRHCSSQIRKIRLIKLRINGLKSGFFYWHDNQYYQETRKHLSFMKKTVIGIFEDDVVSRYIYEKLFENHRDQVEVFIFDTPEKGFEKALLKPFDIVYIEVHFWRHFGGISILGKLKEITSNNMIAVAMTSLLQKGDLERLVACGFNLCVEKPVVFSSLSPPV
jgi:CheY-like chemotaxis protein